MKYNAVTYYRVSTTDQKLISQRESCERYALAYNFNIIKSFEEKQSGTKDDRIELDNMLNYIEENDIKYVICSELSRIGRTNYAIQVCDWLKQQKCCLILIKESIKTIDDNGKENAISSFLINILTAINVMELESIKYRTQNGRISAVAKGGAMSGGSTPFGYMTSDPIHKKMVVNPDEAIIIKQIFQWFIEGNTVYKIGKLLKENNILPKKLKIQWSLATLYAILKNRIYIGERTYLGVIYPIASIIDLDTFNKAQEIIKIHYGTTVGRGKKYEYNYSGKITCGICGQPYYAIAQASKNNRYACNSIRQAVAEQPCGNYGIGITKLEETINEFMLDYFLEIVISKKEESNLVNKLNIVENDIKLLDKLLKTEISKEGKLVDMYIDGTIEKNIYSEKRNDIIKEKDKINFQISQKNIDKIDLMKLIENENDISKIKADWKTNGISKDITQKIINKIVVTKDDTIKLSDNKQDKAVRVDLHIGETIGSYYISQRSNVIRFAGISAMFELQENNQYKRV